MASFASIHSRDTVGDYVEILGLFQPGNEDNRFYASNHSYGVATGWTDIFYYGTPQTPNHLPPAGYYPYWSTDTLLSGGQEDYRWGFYSLDQSWRMDEAVYRSSRLLKIRHSAGLF